MTFSVSEHQRRNVFIFRYIIFELDESLGKVIEEPYFTYFLIQPQNGPNNAVFQQNAPIYTEAGSLVEQKQSLTVGHGRLVDIIV